MPKTNHEDPKTPKNQELRGLWLRQEWQPKPISDVPSIAILCNSRIFVVLEVFEVPKAFG
jgi:hypothetical protein